MGALLVALLLHLALLPTPIRWLGSTRPPAPVEVVQVDPRKLEATRRAWRKQSLLLSDQSKPKEQVEPPPDARYLSDRNIRVDRETVSPHTDTLPRPGAPGPAGQSRTQKQKSPTQTRPIPSLGNLGVPLRLGQLDRTRAPALPTQERSTQGGGGAVQWVDEKKLASAGETLLNAQESVYYSFYSRIYETIGPIWNGRVNDIPRDQYLMDGEFLTLVEVVLSEEGSLLEVVEIKSSGIWQFDKAVHEAWRSVRQFPNPPAGLIGADGRVRMGWTFRVTVQRGGPFQYRPPERRY